MRAMGMRRQADELVLAMNRAAEAAVPESKQLLVDAVKKMSVQDAKGILTGGDTAATDYFKRTTEGDLTKRFLPVVKQATDKVGLAQQYNSLAHQGAAIGLVKEDQSDRKSTRLNSSHLGISYAVFCLKKKKKQYT